MRFYGVYMCELCTNLNHPLYCLKCIYGGIYFSDSQEIEIVKEKKSSLRVYIFFWFIKWRESHREYEVFGCVMGIRGVIS